MPSPVELGRRLKRVRTERDLTLKEVEKKSGVSATHISQIERGMTSPTIGALQRLSRALEIEPSILLEEYEVPEVSLIGRDRRRVIVSENPLITVRSLTAGIPGSRLQVYLMTAQTGGNEPVIVHCHEGEECGTVIKGTMVVTIRGQDYVLEEGMSIHFRATLEHGYRAAGPVECESVWAATSVGFL